MAIKDNRRNSAAVQPVSAGGAGGGSGGVSAERAAGVSGGHGQTSESSGGGKLGVWALAGVVVSSMIGGGIYSLPQNMAAGASVGAVLLAWLITGIGVYFLANTFRILSVVKPDLTAGIYMYSRAGFGPYVGFTIGWSYWLCQICGNVGYAVITMDALNYFFPPYFAGGNGIYSIIGGSLLIWGFNALVLKGIKQATIINLIGTVAKIAPLLFFIVITLIFFNSERFSFDFWGERERSLGGLAKQIEGTMLVTLWAFIGIEGAVVMSKHAKNPKAVGTATLLGFSGCLLIYVLLSVLPYGIMDQEQLSKLPNPSTAAVLEPVIGKWGSYIMNIGLLISVLTSWLAWTMVTAQISAGSGRKRHVSERVCQRKRRTGTVGFSVCYERSDAGVYAARIFFGQCLEHDAQHYQRYGAAGLFCERDVSVETVRRPRIPVRVLYPPVDGAAFRSSGVAVCTLAHLCGRA